MVLEDANAMTTSRTDQSFEGICKEIHDSFQNKDCFLVQALAGLSQVECRKIRHTYMKYYGQDLTQLSGNETETDVPFLSILMLNPYERDAVVARQAIYRNDTVNYTALIEIFASRKSSHFLLILEAYHARYGAQLCVDIAGIEPLHPCQKILMAFAASHKAHHAEISQHIAKCDARRLYQTGEGKTGAIDEAVVLEIFSKRSIEQLKLMFLSYKHIYGHSYTSYLKNGDFGEFAEAVRVVANCISNPPKYYAETLHGLFKGTIDKATLVNVMVSRAEVDMDQIQRVFKKKYGMELKDAILEYVPKENHRDFLVALATKVTG